MKNRRIIFPALGALLLILTGVYLFSYKNPTDSHPQARQLISIDPKQGGTPLTAGTGQLQKADSSSRPDKLERPEELIAGLKLAITRSDQAAISRYFEAIKGAGTACVGPLRDLLVKENDVDAAKTLAYALTYISTPDAYSAALEATTLAENKDTKYAVLELLKDTLDEVSSRFLIKLALSSEKGSVPVAASGLIASSGNPDLLAALVNSAASQDERTIAANILRNSRSPSVDQVLQECTMLPDELLGKAAVAGLAGQSSEQSERLLLNSFDDYGPAPNPERFQIVVAGLQTMLQQNTDKPEIVSTIESVMTTSDSNVTRAAAVAALSNDPGADKKALAQAFEKALKSENDQQVRTYIEQGIRKIHPQK